MGCCSQCMRRGTRKNERGGTNGSSRNFLHEQNGSAIARLPVTALAADYSSAVKKHHPRGCQTVPSHNSSIPPRSHGRSLQGLFPLELEISVQKPVEVEVSAGPLSSDAGLLLIRQFDE